MVLEILGIRGDPTVHYNNIQLLVKPFIIQLVAPVKERTQLCGQSLVISSGKIAFKNRFINSHVFCLFVTNVVVAICYNRSESFSYFFFEFGPF